MDKGQERVDGHCESGDRWLIQVTRKDKVWGGPERMDD
jgi:hypothetical protein